MLIELCQSLKDIKFMHKSTALTCFKYVPKYCAYMHFVKVLITTHSFQECSNIFSKGGGEELAKLTGSVFLGEINEVELHVMLASSHKVSQHTEEAYHSSPTIHE